jgi:probable phosphoglycerate mutase
MRITIVRHGNTFEAGETPRRVGSRTDLPLTAVGVAQAEALGRAFADRSFSRCLVSPLLRTRQTADALLDAAGLELAPEPATFLAEIDHGPDENATDAEIIARIGADALMAWDEQARVPDGWVVDTDARIAAWRDLAASTTGDSLCVTSNGAARFALLAFGLAPQKLRTGAWGIIEAGADGRFELLEWDKRPPALSGKVA